MPRLSDHATLARGLVAEARSAALATLDESGAPFASYVTVAPAADGSPLLLLSRLALHTQNLTRDPRASLLFVREPQPGEESMTAARLTVSGRMIGETAPDCRQRFLARHPDAIRYADFPDFSLYRLYVAGGHLVAGFGRIVALSRKDLVEGVEGLA
jgi:putative heme iron utilization protein